MTDIPPKKKLGRPRKVLPSEKRKVVPVGDKFPRRPTLTMAERKFPSKNAGNFVPNDDHRHYVTLMAANGMGQLAIAQVMSINEHTLKRHFAYELAHGREFVTARMGAVIVQAGLSGNITAAKFWLTAHREEWRAARDLANEQPEFGSGDGEYVRFYLPSNRRDEEIDDPPTIDGKVEAA